MCGSSVANAGPRHRPVDWHREHFHPLTEREHSLLYEHVLEERQQLRDAEERAYDRFLRARDVLAEAITRR